MTQPTWRVGMNGRFFPNNWRPARAEIAFAAANGFTALQFQSQPTGLAAEHLGDTPAVVGVLLREAGLIAVMELPIRIDATGQTPDGKTPLDVLQLNLPAITALRCRCVHWHLVLPADTDATTARRVEQQLLPEYKAAVELGAAHDFAFGIEHNEPGYEPFNSPAACLAVLEKVPGLKFVWDLNHTTPEQLPGFLDLSPYLSMLHVSDTPLPTVNYHLPLGLGTIDFAAYFSALQQRGFAGPAILEIGGLPASGGYGRDTDAALIDSGHQLLFAIENEMHT